MDTRKKAWISALLSLWIPGLGQLYLHAGIAAAFFCLTNALVPPSLLWLLPLLPARTWVYLYFLAGTQSLFLTVAASWHAFHLAERSSLPMFSRRRIVLLLTAALAWYFVGGLPSYAALRWRVEPYRLPTESMLPTLLNGDQFLVDKTIQGAAIQRGMVIVFVPPNNRKNPFAKRVVGLPGDRVQIAGAEIFVNGKSLSQEAALAPGDAEIDAGFLSHQAKSEALNGHRYTVFWPKEGSATLAKAPEEFLVPAASLFVLGDNRAVAYNSRHWGFVPIHNVLGEVKQIYFSWRDNQHLRSKRCGLVVQ